MGLLSRYEVMKVLKANQSFPVSSSKSSSFQNDCQAERITFNLQFSIFNL